MNNAQTFPIHNAFQSIIGQEKVKRKLTHYITGHQKTSLLPTLCFEGPAGIGKTHMYGSLARAVGKSWFEIQGATVKKLAPFVEKVLMPMASGGHVMCVIDEAHNVADEVMQYLLPILNPTSNHKNSVAWEDVTLTFDLRKISFVFATTELQKIFKPMRSRLTSVSLENYTQSELAQIVKLNSSGVNYEEGAELLAAQYTRGTARSAALMGEEIRKQSIVMGQETFTADDFSQLAYVLSMYRYGLTEQEVNILRILGDSSVSTGMALADLTAKTGLTKPAVQEMEMHPRSCNLMRVDGKRHITGKGMEFLKEIN